MRQASAAVQDQLRSLAAVLVSVRGRLAELSSGLAEEEPGEESGPGLRSIISCVLTDSIDPAIRDLLSAAEHEPAEPAVAGSAPLLPNATAEPVYDALWSRLDISLPRLLAEREAASREAEALFLEIASLDSAARPAALEASRFHRAILLDRLLEGAHAALPADPGAAAELAALAASVARRLADPDESIEGRARAACWLAHARRIGGDEAGAEQALSEATLYARYSAEQALLCRALGLLRWEQGKVDEAAALLERAAELWAGEELSHEEGACWVLRALLATEEGKIRDAVGMLRVGLPLLVDPWLTLYGGLALALGLAEWGLAERARAQRDESAPLVHSTPPAAYLYARRLAGRIALSLGEHDAAGETLEELRREALAGRWLPEALIATLDLARLDVERGRSREAAEERAAALESTFGPTHDLAGLLAVLREFPAQLPPGESLQDFTASLAAAFLRALRLRGVRSVPLPFT